MMRPRVVMGLLLLFALIWALLLPGRLAIPAIETFSSDAGDYHAGAVHLLQEGMYSLDGTTPTVAREPGQSVFLAFIYAFFGIGNRIALFAVQGILVACSAWVFARQLARISSPRVGELFLLILFLLPSVYHSIFSALRESLALSLLMLVASGLLCLLHRPTWRTTTLTGLLLGCLLLTYAPYLLLPLFLVPFLLLLRLRVSHLIVLCIIPLLFAAAWGYRNAGVTGEACLTGCSRAAAAWYVRGEQAEQISGFEPVRCLWAEYISRDWSTVSFACSFNAVKNTKWPEGVPGDSSAIAAGKSGQQKILQHFGNYLWFSVFEIVELHLPFVD